jgi:DNA topoisomerase IB
MQDGGKRKGGWARAGRSGRFRHLDRNGRRIEDPDQLERIESLAIPPGWRDVWISPRPAAKLQATGYDRAGRKQHLYHAEYRAAQEKASFDRLIRFGEHLPGLRTAMTAHLERDELDRERVAAIALRLIALGGSASARSATPATRRTACRHCSSATSASAVAASGSCLPSKAGSRVRSELVDEEFAGAIRALLAVQASPFQVPLGRRPLQPESDRERKRSTTAVMQRVAKRLGNTPVVVEQYHDGRTIDDFRPKHLRVVKARDPGLNPEEQAMLSLLRLWRIRSARKAP